MHVDLPDIDPALLERLKGLTVVSYGIDDLIADVAEQLDNSDDREASRARVRWFPDTHRFGVRDLTEIERARLESWLRSDRCLPTIGMAEWAA